MLGKKNSLANGLLRRPLNGKQPNKPTKDIKEFINYKLSALKYIASLVKIEVDFITALMENSGLQWTWIIVDVDYSRRGLQ